MTAKITLGSEFVEAERWRRYPEYAWGMYFFLGSVSHYNIPELVQTVKTEICSVVTRLGIGGSCQFSGL